MSDKKKPIVVTIEVKPCGPTAGDVAQAIADALNASGEPVRAEVGPIDNVQRIDNMSDFEKVFGQSAPELTQDEIDKARQIRNDHKIAMFGQRYGTSGRQPPGDDLISGAGKQWAVETVNERRARMGLPAMPGGDIALPWGGGSPNVQIIPRPPDAMQLTPTNYSVWYWLGHADLPRFTLGSIDDKPARMVAHQWLHDVVNALLVRHAMSGDPHKYEPHRVEELMRDLCVLVAGETAIRAAWRLGGARVASALLNELKSATHDGDVTP